MGSGFAKMKKQARQMQQEMSKQLDVAKEARKQQRFIGTSGNGLIRLSMDGDKILKELTIKPECVNPSDVEGLQDLILAAYQNALEQVPDEEQDFPFSLPG